MKKSNILKKKLATSLLSNIEMAVKKGTPPNVQSVARGYAAILLSVANYGFQVANRREHPASGFQGKETAISSSELDGEETYLRTVLDHPSREIYKILSNQLKKIPMDEGLRKNLNKFLNDQNHVKYDLRIIGQCLTPEEVVEHVFSQLPIQNVLQLTKLVLTQILQPLKTIPQNLQDKSIEFKRGRTEVSDFSMMRQKRMVLLKAIAQEIKADDCLPCEAPKSDYPCITFDLRNIAKRAEIKYIEGEKIPKNIENLSKLLMCYFSGIINHCSMKHYGADFIWVQPQSSFGSLRPSLSPTGYSFRFSVGLVPDDFKIVMKESYEIFVKTFNDFQKSHEWQKILADNLKFFDEHWVNHDAQLLALTAVTEESSNPFNEFLQQLNKYKKHGKQAIRKQREDLFRTAQAAIFKQNPKPVPAQACKELLGLRDNLLNLISKLDAQESFSLMSFEKELQKMIKSVADSATETDYSEVVGDIETLARLMKIQYELNLIRKREKEENSDLKELPISTAPPLERCISSDSTLSEDAYAFRSGMHAFTLVYKTLHTHYHGSERTYSAEEVYFELNSETIKNIVKFYQLEEKQTFKETKDVGTVHFLDIAQFPNKPSGESTPSIWKQSWDKIKDQLPEILAIDITSASKEDLEFIADETKKNPNAKPYIILTFSSDNKFAQMGLDLVSMGEVRFFAKTPTENEVQEKLTDLCQAIKEEFKQAQQISTSARAYRKLIKDLGQRRSLKPAESVQSTQDLEQQTLDKLSADPGVMEGIFDIPVDQEDQELDQEAETKEIVLRTQKEIQPRLLSLLNIYTEANRNKIPDFDENLAKLKECIKEFDDIEKTATSLLLKF